MFESLKRLIGLRPSPEEMFRGLREQLFTAPFPGTIAVIDWHVGTGIATIVAVADGTVSLYLSSGGGVIGAGTREAPRRAGQAMVEAGSAARDLMKVGDPNPLPLPETARFHLRTADGVRSASVPMSELEDPGHPLHAYFDAGQRVLTAIRELPQ